MQKWPAHGTLKLLRFIPLGRVYRISYTVWMILMADIYRSITQVKYDQQTVRIDTYALMAFNYLIRAYWTNITMWLNIRNFTPYWYFILDLCFSDAYKPTKVGLKISRRRQLHSNKAEFIIVTGASVSTWANMWMILANIWVKCARSASFELWVHDKEHLSQKAIIHLPLASTTQFVCRNSILFFAKIRKLESASPNNLTFRC